MSTLFGAGDEVHTKKGKKNKHSAAHWTLPSPSNDTTGHKGDPRPRRSTSRSPAPQNTFEIHNIESHKSSKQMDYSSQNQEFNGENEVTIPMLEGTRFRFSKCLSLVKSMCQVFCNMFQY